MDETKELRRLSLSELTEMLARDHITPGQGRRAEAELRRRTFVVQRGAAWISAGSLVVSALAIVVGAASSVRTDRTVSAAALEAVSQSCVLPTLPTEGTATMGDLEETYVRRGAALLECDIARSRAIDMLKGG